MGRLFVMLCNALEIGKKHGGISFDMICFLVEFWDEQKEVPGSVLSKEVYSPSYWTPKSYSWLRHKPRPVSEDRSCQHIQNSRRPHLPLRELKGSYSESKGTIYWICFSSNWLSFLMRSCFMVISIVLHPLGWILNPCIISLRENCYDIQGPAINVILPKIHVNRNT